MSPSDKNGEVGEVTHDPVIHDMLVARVEAHRKAAWLLRSHFE